MGACCCHGQAPSRVLPSPPDDEYAEFVRLMQEDLAVSNPHGWQVKKNWPSRYTDDFKMRVCLRPHRETGNPNKLLRGDGKFRGVRPEYFLEYLLNPNNLPGLQEWIDVEQLPDGYIKYCRVRAPLMTPRDHCWRYSISRRDDGSIFVCIRTTTHAMCPERPGVIRAYYYNSSLFRMSEEEEGVVEMTEFVFQDLKGGLSPAILNSALPAGTIRTNQIVMRHFKERGLFRARS